MDAIRRGPRLRRKNIRKSANDQISPNLPRQSSAPPPSAAPTSVIGRVTIGRICRACRIPHRVRALQHPAKTGRDRKLAHWGRNQRAAAKHKRRTITAERVRRLNELGFTWMLVDPLSREHMFAALYGCKKRHGHCKVPQNWPEDKRLGKWVNAQRTHATRGTLKSDRRRQLDEIDFV